jgi:hypothetical protein
VTGKPAFTATATSNLGFASDSSDGLLRADDFWRFRNGSNWNNITGKPVFGLASFCNVIPTNMISGLGSAAALNTIPSTMVTGLGSAAACNTIPYSMLTGTSGDILMGNNTTLSFVLGNNTSQFSVLSVTPDDSVRLRSPTTGMLRINPDLSSETRINQNNSAGTSLYHGSGVVLSTAATAVNIPGSTWMEFGQGVTKQSDAGRISYQRYSTGLDIVGASVGTALPRRVTIFDEVTVSRVNTSTLQLGTSTIKGVFCGVYTVPSSGGGDYYRTVTHNWNISGAQFFTFAHVDLALPKVLDSFAFKVTAVSANSFDITIVRTDNASGSSQWTREFQLHYTITVV